MKPEDVQFTDRMIQRYKSLNGRPKGKNKLWNDEDIDAYIKHKKEAYFINFHGDAIHRIKMLYPELEVSTKTLNIENLMVDYHKYGDSYYNIFIGIAECHGIRFIVFEVGNMGWASAIENKFFKFEDLNIDLIHNNIDWSTSIQNSKPIEYIKKLIKPRPVADASTKKARKLFGGLMD